MLSLANRLRAIDSDTAPAGLRERSLQADAIADTFDLAEALLRPESVTSALHARSRAELTVLRAVTPEAIPTSELGIITGLAEDDFLAALARCDELFLVERTGDTVHGYVEVIAALDSAGIPSLDDLRHTETPAAISQHGIDTTLLDRRAAEHGGRTTALVAELVFALESEPARELAKGGLALPDVKRIAAALHVELVEVALIHRIASLAGLVFHQGGQWLPAIEADAWLSGDGAERWVALAEAVWRSQPLELRVASRAWVSEAPREKVGLARLTEILRWQFPALEHLDHVLDTFVETATPVGLVVGNDLSQLGRSIAAGFAHEDLIEVASAALPQTVNQVYLQPDCSLIVPGPASAWLDRTLRQFTDVEHADMASSFRLSSGSVHRALATGMTVTEIREVLAKVSLTGIPQPVDYLLTEAEQRFGQVRVREATELPYASVVRSLDAHLLELLSVDQQLAALNFVRNQDTLQSRASVAHVLLTLDAAKYPAALEDDNGTIIALRPNYASARSRSVTSDPIALLWARVRESVTNHHDDTAWLSRQILGAVKAKTALVVEVSLPAGGTAEYLLEPTGIAGNRMRARDRKADIERTLPLGSIVGIRAAGAPAAN